MTAQQRIPRNHTPVLLQAVQVVTLRQYLLQQLPTSSKSRRRRIQSLGVARDQGHHTTPKANGQDTRFGGQIEDIARLLDTTLVGVLKETSPTTSQERHRDYVSFSQSRSQSQFTSTDTGPACPQSEIVDFVISALFNRTGFSYQKPQHILTHGFQRAAPRKYDRGALASGIPGIVVQYPNGNYRALRQAPWTDVLGLLGSNGEEIMLRLLFDCGIFSGIDHQRGMFYQISGPPLSNLEPLEKADPLNPTSKPAVSITTTDREIQTERKKDENGPKTVVHKPNSISFFRRRMLYARPSLNSRGEVQFGLKHMHVLNRFSSSDSLSQTVHVMKYIFPRQFGLHNVFTSVTDSRETVLPFKDYTFREEEIFRAEALKRHRRQKPSVTPADEEDQRAEPIKIPKRLRGEAVNLVQKLQSRNKGFSYVELLKYYCPSESSGPWKFGSMQSQPDSKAPSSDPKSSVSEQLVTQARISHHSSPGGALMGFQSNQPIPSSLNGESGGNPTVPAPKISLTEYATPPSSVSAFCRAVLRKLIPPHFYGTGQHGKLNEKIIHKHVDQFIRMRRFETLSLHQVCKGLKITSIPWIAPPGIQDHERKLSLSDLQKRTELIHEFIYYIFDSILIPLIWTNFYVTESQTHRNRLFYFRHDVWRRLIERPLAELKSSMFEEMKPDKAMRVLGRRSLGYSALRLLPKATGIRPILNLRKRTLVKGSWGGKNGRFLGSSINSTITPIFNMLNYEKSRKPHVLGSALHHVGEIYPRLKCFKERLEQRHTEGHGSSLPPLYFVKLDIQSCFDTIPQRKLVRLVEELVSEEAYNITKHVEVRPQGDLSSFGPVKGAKQTKAMRKYVGRAAPGMKPQHLPEVIASGATGRRRNTVFVDTMAHKEHNTEDLLDLLDEHVRNNLVKIGKKYFRQRSGIPQGSVMSSLLCNFFYAELERKVLGFLQSDDALLLRLVDDFLLITSNTDLATQFLQVMIKGQPEYGVSVNPTKSLVNFSVAIDGIHIPRLVGTSLFPYCGNLIDTSTLGLFKDQGRILEGGDSTAAALSNALTVELTRAPGRSLHRKLLAAFKLQMHPMYLDTKHNTSTGVLSNLYANLVTSAMKMYRYMKSLQGRAHPTPDVVIRIIQDIISLAQRLTHSKRGDVATDSNSEVACSVSQMQVQYLAAAAFRFVLNRKQTRYAIVLRWLEQLGKAVRPKSDRKAIRMAQVVRSGNATFGGWRF
ncbi:hypothetical protein MW887_007311 [Aspergillus wentii]|nr:hypothetical protein MW887_007311 [Aspergillus wentii]